jgi:hypothetical protein
MAGAMARQDYDSEQDLVVHVLRGFGVGRRLHGTQPNALTQARVLVVQIDNDANPFSYLPYASANFLALVRFKTSGFSTPSK